MKLGCVPSPWDTKRLLYMVRSPSYQEAVQLPAEYDGLADYVYCLGDQGDVGSCTGWAGAGLMHAIVNLNDDRLIRFSAGSIYAHARSYCNPPLPDDVQGAHPLSVMKTLAKDGATTEECAPTDTSYPFKLIECGSWREIAAEYKIGTYRQVPTDPESLKAAIYGVTYVQPYRMPDGAPGKCPLFIAIPVYQSFDRADDNGGIAPMPVENEPLRGGHAVLIRGWKLIAGKPHWVMVNSWGTSKGDRGIYYLPFGYPIWEAWMITDDAPLPPPGPEPPGPARKSWWEVFRIVWDKMRGKIYHEEVTDSMVKEWWKSKTLWLNVLAAAIVIVQALQGQPWLEPEIQVAILAVLNAILRLVTSQAIAGTPVGKRLAGKKPG
jgi:hypothetical protein